MQVDRPIKFRIATYNVRNLFDNVDDPEKDDGPPAWEWRKGDIADIIASSKADIVVLQEVENREVLMDTLRKRGLDKVYRHVIVAPSDSRGIAVALLSRFPVKSYKFHTEEFRNIITGEPMRFKRPVLSAVIELAPGFQVKVFTAHLKSKREHRGDTVYHGLKENELRRYSEAYHLRQLAEQSELPTVIAGDFNDTPDSYTLKLLQDGKPIPQDIRPDEPAKREHRRFFDISELVRSKGKQIVTHHRGEQLDYILVSPELRDKVTYFDVIGPEDNPEADDASDHFMVVAEFQLKPSSEKR